MARNSGNKENDSAANCWFFAHFQNQIEHANDIHMKIMAPPSKFRSFSIKLEAQAHKRQHEQQNYNFLALRTRTIVQRVEARRERRESSSQHHY